MEYVLTSREGSLKEEEKKWDKKTHYNLNKEKVLIKVMTGEPQIKIGNQKHSDEWLKQSNSSHELQFSGLLTSKQLKNPKLHNKW